MTVYKNHGNIHETASTPIPSFQFPHARDCGNETEGEPLSKRFLISMIHKSLVAISAILAGACRLSTVPTGSK